MTWLHGMVASNDVASARLLIKRGANVEIADVSGTIPLKKHTARPTGYSAASDW